MLRLILRHLGSVLLLVGLGFNQVWAMTPDEYERTQKMYVIAYDAWVIHSLDASKGKPYTKTIDTLMAAVAGQNKVNNLTRAEIDFIFQQMLLNAIHSNAVNPCLNPPAV